MNKMYDDYNIVKATADAINNAEHNKTFTNNQKKSGTKKLLNEDDGNISLIAENFENIKYLIDNFVEDIQDIELDTANIDVIYSMQDILKDTLAILKDKTINKMQS